MYANYAEKKTLSKSTESLLHNKFTKQYMVIAGSFYSNNLFVSHLISAFIKGNQREL